LGGKDLAPKSEGGEKEMELRVSGMEKKKKKMSRKKRGSFQAKDQKGGKSFPS